MTALLGFFLIHFSECIISILGNYFVYLLTKSPLLCFHFSPFLYYPLFVCSNFPEYSFPVLYLFILISPFWEVFLNFSSSPDIFYLSIPFLISKYSSLFSDCNFYYFFMESISSLSSLRILNAGLNFVSTFCIVSFPLKAEASWTSLYIKKLVGMYVYRPDISTGASWKFYSGGPGVSVSIIKCQYMQIFPSPSTQYFYISREENSLVFSLEEYA